MREIKFRGKAIDEGHWVFGNYIHECIGIASYIDGIFNLTLVNSDTVGQYTGLADKYGNYIYEGDILGILDTYPSSTLPRVSRYKVVNFCGVILAEPVDSYTDAKQPLYFMCTISKVLGNIYDNKDLLDPVYCVESFSI